MKSIIWPLLILQLFFQDISCNDSILSKFHQNNYKLRDIRVEMNHYSKEYFYFFEIKTNKYNRTTPATSGNIKMKITVKDKVELLVQCYKFVSNEYRVFPIRFQVNLKKTVDSNALGLKAIRNCGNLTNFVLEKDVTYYFCNFVIDETQFPPLIPTGIYKVDVRILYLDEEIAYVSGFGEVYTPIAYPRN